MTKPAKKATDWKNRILRTGGADPATLLPNPQNWRTHPALQAKGVRAVLDRVGWVQPVLVNQRTGLLVDGHLRVALALEKKVAEIPVAYVDLTPEEEALILATLDPLAGLAGTNVTNLEGLLGQILREPGSDLDALLAKIGKEAGADFGTAGLLPAEPPAGALPPHPITKAGDVILLGRHRLVCGSSTQRATWELAFPKSATAHRAAMIWTDPPYGVNYEGVAEDRNRKLGRKQRRVGATLVSNDNLDDAGLTKLLTDAFTLALDHAKPAAIFYVTAPSGPRHHIFGAVLLQLGIWKQMLIWRKSAFVLGRGDYHYQHEPMFYGWAPGGGKHHFIDDRTQASVWDFPRPQTSPEHPTMKPLDLVKRSIENSSHEGQVVVDPFAGSGTTLLAAEVTKRRAVVIELDPRYCDVIVQRWETMTGQKAKRPAKGRG